MIVIVAGGLNDLEATFLIQPDHRLITPPGVGHNPRESVPSRPGDLPALKPLPKASALALRQDASGNDVKRASTFDPNPIRIVVKICVTLKCAAAYSLAVDGHPVRFKIAPVVRTEPIGPRKSCVIEGDQRVSVSGQRCLLKTYLHIAGTERNDVYPKGINVCRLDVSNAPPAGPAQSGSIS
jgi:hypothetical protein